MWQLRPHKKVKDTETQDSIFQLSFLSTATEWTAFIPDNNAMALAKG